MLIKQRCLKMKLKTNRGYSLYPQSTSKLGVRQCSFPSVSTISANSAQFEFAPIISNCEQTLTEIALSHSI